MPEPRRIGIGLVGTGFLAATRARCYGALAGRAAIVAVAARTPARTAEFARRWDIPRAIDFESLLADPTVEMVDLCVPNALHRPLCEAAAAAGKHVVCTKPLSAYVGQDLATGHGDAEVASRDRRAMAALATAEAQSMVDAARSFGVQLMYGENWLYAPSIRRAAELLERADSTILDLRGGEAHSGSHSPYSRSWRHTGGGALLRLGSHPIGAMLHLKAAEGRRRRGTPIRPVAVVADVADPQRSIEPSRTAYVARGFVDVESHGTTLIEFDDGSRGNAWGSDTMLGGMESRLDIQASNLRLTCNLSPNDMLRSYAPDVAVLADTYLMEKVSTTAGWNSAIPDEDFCSGQLAMCADFVAALAEGRPAIADGELGLEVVKVVYASYVAAAEGRRVRLSEISSW
jgi:predicted dehydrogenase